MPGLDLDTARLINGFPVWDETLTEKGGRGYATGTRTLRTLWQNRYDVLDALAPGAQNVGGIYVFNAIGYPGNPNLLPESYTITGDTIIGEDSDGNVLYDRAVITLEYASLKGGGSANGFVELDIATNVITLPRTNRALEVVPPGGGSAIPVLPNDNPPLPLVTYTLTRVLRNVAGLPIGVYQTAAKKPINSTAVAEFEAGTVIFQGGRAFRQTASNSGLGIDRSPQPLTEDEDPASSVWSGTWDVELRYLVRPGLPWDYLPYYGNNGMTWGGFGKARFNDGSEFIGRSDLNLLTGRNNGTSL